MMSEMFKLQTQRSSNIGGNHVNFDRRSRFNLEVQAGLEEEVDAHKILPDELRCVELFQDDRVGDVSDVRLDLGINVELVAVDFGVRCDVFGVEGELVRKVWPRCLGNGGVIRECCARLWKMTISGVFGER